MEASAIQFSNGEEPAEKRVKLDPVKLAYEKEVRRQTAIVLDYQQQLTRLQSRLHAAEQRERRLAVTTDAEREGLKTAAQQAVSQMKWLEVDLKRVQDENRELSKAAAAAKSQLRAVQLSLDSKEMTIKQQAELKIQEMEKEVLSLRQQLAATRSDQLAAESAQQLAETQLAAAQRAAAQREDLDAARREAEQTVQLIAAQNRVKELENQLATLTEDARLAQLMREQLAEHPRLREQNRLMSDELRTLRLMVDRTLVLEERAAVLQQKADHCDQLRLELETVKQQCAETQQKLAGWRAAAGDDVIDHSQLAQVVTSLRRERLLAEEAAGAARADLRASEARAGRLAAEREQQRDDDRQHQQAALQAQVQLRKLQRKLTLVSMERDSCKRVLAAYEAETTTSLTAIELQRNEDRDRQLAAYRQQLDLLERQLETATASGQLVLCAEDPEAVQRLQQQLQPLHDQLQQLQTEKEGLEAQLEERALRGDYNPATTRVVSLKENPAAAAASKRSGLLEKLQSENQELRARIEVLTADGAAGGLSEEAAKQISAVRSQLRASELRQRRLKEVFSRSTQELRHTISQLTGYKVNVDGAEVKLRSVYAPRPEHCLMFHRDGGGTIQMLETAFSAQLSELVDQYLLREDSLPGFLAALTLHLVREGPPAPPAPAAAAAAPPDDDDCEIVELD